MRDSRAYNCGARARWSVLVSGRGSNLLGALDLGAHADLRLVFSSQPEAPAVSRARRRGITVLTLPKVIDWDEILRQLLRSGINRVALLGFMRLVPASFLEKWDAPIFNLHPSLLPLFPGLKAIEKSFEASTKMGVSLHEVTAEMDAGAIRYQQESVAVPGFYDLARCRQLIAKDEQKLVRRLLLSPSVSKGAA